MSRRGFTLLEVVLVAGLLVVLTAAAVPSIAALLERQAVMTAAGDAVRFLDESRRRAVEEGIGRWVRLESGGGMMMSGPLGDSADHESELAGPCAFEEFDPSERLSGVVAEAAGAFQTEAAWSPAATFRPDGSSTDLAFTVLDDAGRRRDLTLRGLTGRTVVGTSP